MIKTFSLSQALLAMAIAYFAYALLSFTKEIPLILKSVDRVIPHISAIVNEVELVRAEVVEVRALVDKQVPAILMQISTVLPLIEQGLVQSDGYAKQLPELWQQLDKIEARIQALQHDLPAILQRVDAVIATTNHTMSELEKWRPHSSQYLVQIENSRQDIPQYLTRIEGIVVDAKTIGREASSGLVSGFFKGVISLPLDVVAGLTGIVDAKSRSAKFLSAKDVTILQEQVFALLANKSKTQMSWINEKSGNSGKILKAAEFKREGAICHHLTFINNFNNQQETLKELMCQDEEGLWQVI